MDVRRQLRYHTMYLDLPWCKVYARYHALRGAAVFMAVLLVMLWSLSAGGGVCVHAARIGLNTAVVPR